MTEPQQQILAASQVDHVPVYVVQVYMSSPNFTAGSRDIGDYIHETTYTFSKKERDLINKIRTAAKKPIYDLLVTFPPSRTGRRGRRGLQLCNGDQREWIQKAVDNARRELQEIDKGLNAEVWFIPIERTEVFRGELYEAILDAIKAQIFGQILDRLNEVLQTHKSLPENSRKSLLAILRRAQEINVLGDDGIKGQIEYIRTALEADVVPELVQYLSLEVKIATSRWAHLEE